MRGFLFDLALMGVFFFVVLQHRSSDGWAYGVAYHDLFLHASVHFCMCVLILHRR